VPSGRPNARRRLHNTVRRTLLSYYSQEEAAEIIEAAKTQRVTISNFVASAALKAARATLRAPKKQQ